MMNVGFARRALGIEQQALLVLRCLLQALPEGPAGAGGIYSVYLPPTLSGLMVQAELDRQLAALARAGLIRRIEMESGQIKHSLSPLVEREEELEALAEAGRADDPGL